MPFTYSDGKFLLVIHIHTRIILMKELWLRLAQQSDCCKGYVTIPALGTDRTVWSRGTLPAAPLCWASCHQPTLPLTAKQAVRGAPQLPVHWISLKLPASKNNPKKLPQKQLPRRPLHNPVYLLHMLCKGISLLNSTESTSNLLKREQNTMDIFWSGTVQYLRPFFPTTVMLQTHFMWVDLVRQAGISKTLQCNKL